MILIVHRYYRLKGGEDLFLDETLAPALRARGIAHEVLAFEALFSRRSAILSDLLEMAGMVLGLERLRPSYWKIRVRASVLRPRAVVFNNFIPTLSLAAPAWTRRQGILTYAWVHNGRLSCANGLFYDGSAVCHRCFDQGSSSLLSRRCFSGGKQKLLYAWIYRGRRVFRRLRDALDGYLVCSNYSAQGVTRLVQAEPNFRPRTHLIRPPTPPAPTATAACRPEFLKALAALPQPFYAFVGRISYEKGADRFLELARHHPTRGFVLAGNGPLAESLRAEAPKNAYFAGFVRDAEKLHLYQHANALIVPSRVPENASLVIMESETFRTPIVYPTGGGAEESVAFYRRAGCPLEAFTGQTFDRAGGGLPTPWGLAEFADAVRAAIDSAPAPVVRS